MSRISNWRLNFSDLSEESGQEKECSMSLVDRKELLKVSSLRNSS